MKPTDETLVTRYIDGDLKGNDLTLFENRLEREPELRDAIAGAASIGEGIRGIFADADVVGHDLRMAATSLDGIEVPNAEAFTSGILDRIDSENPEA